MRFHTLATDYDGTIARDGIVDDQTFEALARLRETGRKLIMVTGRELDDLIRVCGRIDLFDLIVAENGAVLYNPKDKLEAVLSGGPSLELVNRLKAVGVPNISVGRSIIALWKPNEVEALEAIRDLGLELHIVFNKEAVMILPSAVNKATGLAEALKKLDLDVTGVVGVGDAENDHSFIKSCGYRVAVANAIPSLKDEVDLVTEGARGDGVRQLISRLIDAEDGLISVSPEKHKPVN
jgi:hydroxymethylpyrimidine pyrophosphatase-like HAD family hydrolase